MEEQNAAREVDDDSDEVSICGMLTVVYNGFQNMILNHFLFLY